MWTLISKWLDRPETDARSQQHASPQPEVAPPKPTPAVAALDTDLVSAADRDAILLPAFDTWLAPLGFVQRPGRRWVRSTDAPIRQTFEIMLWKGAVAAPRWGVSLDFVPHVISGRVAWHRTEKSARNDIFVDPEDGALDMSFLHGQKHLRAALHHALTPTIEAADAFWNEARDISSLPALFDRIAAQNANAALSHSPYRDMTRAFLRAAAGQSQDAAHLLEEWLTTYNRTPPGLDFMQAEKLRSALQTAGALPLR